MVPTDAPPPDLSHGHGGGRKKKKAADESLRVRRERNRQAQNELRRRKKVAQQAVEKRVILTEETTEKMTGVFVEFADEVLRSDGAKLDSGLIQTVQRYMKHALVLAKASEGEPEAEPDLAPAANDNFEDGSQPLIGSGLPLGLETKVGWLLWNGNEARQSTPTSDAAHHATSFAAEVTRRHNPPMQNVFGNGWLGYLPPAYTHVRDMEIGQEGPSDSLSMKILLFTMRRAYFCLLETEGRLNSLAPSAFEFSLQQHSREELLFTLRWFLGPGSPSLYRLAENPIGSLDSQLTVPILHPSVDNAALQAAQGVSLGDHKPFLNAQNIEKFLSSLGMHYIENNNLELSVRIDADGRYLISYQDVYSAWQPFAFLNLDHLFPSQEVTACPMDENPPRSPGMIRVRISHAKLLHNLSKFSLCLAYGPAFPRACLQQVIEASLIHPITH